MFYGLYIFISCWFPFFLTFKKAVKIWMLLPLVLVRGSEDATTTHVEILTLVLSSNKNMNPISSYFSALFIHIWTSL